MRLDHQTNLLYTKDFQMNSKGVGSVILGIGWDIKIMILSIFTAFLLLKRFITLILYYLFMQIYYFQNPVHHLKIPRSLTFNRENARLIH